jgi:hypothetical protein
VKPLLFGQWLPDQPSFANQGLLEATNVYPGARGYRPVGQFVQTVPSGAADFLGGATFTSSRGENVVIAGTSSNLYRVTAGTFTSIASGYTTSGRWRFAQFGGLAIATNDSNPMQKIDLDTGIVSVLGGSPPTFRILAVVKDFLVGGVLDGQTNMVGWSAINNAEDWTFGQNQSDYNIMPSGGDINGLFGGEFGLILQRNRITRMEYVGGNEIFVINEISTNFGCVSPHSVVQHGQIGCFLSDNGFMMWTGAELKPIGSERIDRFFLSSYSRSAWESMSAAVDVKNQVFCWSMGDRIFNYHWLLDRWSVIDLAAQIVFSGVTRSLSIDEQDPDIGVNDDNLDYAGLPSMDSAQYMGGDPAFYVIDATRALGTLTGTPMAATLTLPDFELVRGRESHLKVVRPDTDAISGITLSISSRERLGDAIAYNAYSSLRPNGDMPVRERGRYSRFSLGYAAGTVWTYAQGLTPDVVPGAIQ